MEHHHHHHPAPDLQKLNRSFIIGIVLNVLFVVAEAGAGFYYDSLALLSDAGQRRVPCWYRCSMRLSCSWRWR